ncbi:SMP-30/gluconolactonase/LRE family protein [Agromyces ramosus]|uniref:Sugar lactone lactonase YvrE n=1 Tax=Agromyces ramosus TaxID=33879 RepID=A0ABU0R7B7_9MICO|nr:SMP-30/gluconolactonase/LRE family protein [Agromyces ramosus]MDQ0893986.1 sugar lactone lactonase YvrE [Agromyces ramosus]
MSEVTVLESPDVVIEGDAAVGEGPVFDARTGRLVWVDITGGMIFENDLASGEQQGTKLDTLVGGVAPRASDPGFAVAVGDGFGFVSADGVLTYSDPVLPEPFRRMNDAKVDSRGRLWAGSTHTEFLPGEGSLHRWDGGRSSVMATGFILPNGLGWDAADTTMYLIDSYANTLLSAPFRADDGDIGDFTPMARIEGGYPDGLAVDVDGCIWVAIWAGHEVRRYSPTGELVAVVPMPVAQPSSCAFGSDGTLYITSARAGLSEAELVAQPHAGSVFALSTDTQGVPVRAFAS